MIRRLLHAWAGKSHRSAASIPVAVKCSAGHIVRGLRQRRHQIVRCAECGLDVFILPRTPFLGGGGKPGPEPTQPRGSPWRRPLLAAVLTLLVVAGALVLFLTALTRKAIENATFEAHLSAAENALTEGKLRRAAEELDKARELALRREDALPAAELRDLTHRLREASLLADLLPESLGEILVRAARAPEDEWKAQFAKRYRGPGQANAVVFDAEVRRDGAGQYHLDWELTAGDEPARLEIGGLQLLHDLPLNEPHRLLFGARLESIAREQNGVWVVRFEPTSGVLLTDPRAVAACYPGPSDAELLKLLEQQRQWMQGK